MYIIVKDNIVDKFNGCRLRTYQYLLSWYSQQLIDKLYLFLDKHDNNNTEKWLTNKSMTLGSQMAERDRLGIRGERSKLAGIRGSDAADNLSHQ